MIILQQVTKMSKQTLELEKTIGEHSGSAKQHLTSVQQLANQVNKTHSQFNQNLSQLLIGLSQLREKVKNNPHELKKFMIEQMRVLEDQMIMGEQIQKQQNKSSQEFMTEIKRENKQTSQAIVKTFEKVC